MAKDQDYILDLCDRVVGEPSSRQHTFNFLVGLESRNTKRRHPLPVDAYYADRNLVIEYHECQHTRSVKFWNKMTACGLPRDEQRRCYDNLRRELLPKNGVALVILDPQLFDLDGRGRLLRTEQDERVIGDILKTAAANNSLLFDTEAYVGRLKGCPMCKRT